jgi:DUF4097 and DUF4098 domain-containing protein YvlB
MRTWQYHACRGLCGLLVVVTTGCNLGAGFWSNANFETSARQQHAMPSGTTLDVDTQSGSVTITGADVGSCDVSAKIVGHAPTADEAQQLAEQTEIKLELVGQTLRVRAATPQLRRNRSVSVSYTITAPHQMNVVCRSAYGSLRLSGIEGTVNGRTSSGGIYADNIQGETNLRTSYGSVQCRAITGGPITLHSSSGGIRADDIQGPTTIETSYGSITCQGFVGDGLSLKTSSGSIALADGRFETCDASSSYGAVSANNVEGQAIELHSGSGNVTLADAVTDQVQLSTSYGRISARRLTASEVDANSGSGSIDIDCSTASPNNITARVKTSYGSIDFTAPPEYAGDVHLATGYGSVRTARPVTVSGTIRKERVIGRIGDGSGSLHLETSSGSIALQ